MEFSGGTAYFALGAAESDPFRWMRVILRESDLDIGRLEEEVGLRLREQRQLVPPRGLHEQGTILQRNVDEDVGRGLVLTDIGRENLRRDLDLDSLDRWRRRQSPACRGKRSRCEHVAGRKVSKRRIDIWCRRQDSNLHFTRGS